MLNIPSFQIITPIYPDSAPFSPDKNYPEYVFGDLSNKKNEVYDSVRTLLFEMGFDKENFNSKKWNPLGHVIKPGDCVIIKPNWVHHNNPVEKDLLGMLTHSSVIRPVLDYVLIALQDTGEIIIGDAPIESADFNLLMDKTNISSTVDFLKSKTNVTIKIKDFRREINIRKREILLSREYKDSDEFVSINLKEKSYLKDIQKDYIKFRVTNYDKDKMLQYHNEIDNIYVIHKDVFRANAIIYIPKLKTHRKAGITNCLKNSIGINAQKDCLAHHRKGSIFEGGDAYKEKDILKRLKENILEVHNKNDSIFIQLILLLIVKIINKLNLLFRKDPFYEGSWYGNDTLWRVILDLATILFYIKPDGTYSDEVQKKAIYIIDGIVAGAKEGPLKPSNHKLGLLAAGTNPLLLDLICAKLIGYDYQKIPTLCQGLRHNLFSLDEQTVNDESININGNTFKLKDISPIGFLQPAFGWENHIELKLNALINESKPAK